MAYRATTTDDLSPPLPWWVPLALSGGPLAVLALSVLVMGAMVATVACG